MSRRALALGLILVLPLFGCRKAKAAEPLSTDFVCAFHAQYQNMTVDGTLTRHTAGTLLLEFSNPETLAGLSAEWGDESVRLRYKGLSYTVAPDSLPESALGESLMAAFDAAARGEGTRKETDGSVTVNGLSGTVPYTYVYDKLSGAPLSLSAPSIPLDVTFFDIQTQ